ncbi:MAG TPA: cell division protein FtsA [Candidatus Limnocylindria bacterium]|nr:cell division protein FtsA [Candidatus Limnocylindria bacterium]
MDRETVLVGIDAGTTKVTTLIGEVGRSGDVNIIGYGIGPSVGMKKGMVANIDQTVGSIGASIEKAERLSGYKISSAFVSVGGSHIASQNSRGVVAVSGHKREVSREDVARATDAAKAIQVPSNRELLHVLPRGYIVDGQDGIKDPLGMSAVRLEVETHIVAGAATSISNLTKCISQANVAIDELVISSLAAAEATLTDTEKDLGVLVADIGGGTTDIAIFTDGAVYHSAVLPVGGINVTNDVAIGLRTSLNLAEEIKIKHGTADVADVAPEELLNVAVLGEGSGQTIQRRKLCEIIAARMEEIFGLIREEVKRSGHAGMLPAGVVLTGGGARLAGSAELAREVLEMPVRVGSPQGVGGLMDQLSNPAFSTPIGLLLWGATHAGEEPLGSFGPASPFSNAGGRFMDWLRGLFPG